MLQVAPQIARTLAAAGAFEIHDLDDARIEPRYIRRARGFDHHGAALSQERSDQLMHAILEQRLTPGDLDQVASVAIDLREDFGNRHLAAFIERLSGSAMVAAQVPSAPPHECPRP